MLTLEEARTIQKNEEKKTLLRFLISAAVFGMAFFLLFCFTDLLYISKTFLILPAISLIVIIYYNHMIEFLSPKEFVGKIVRINFFSIRDNTVKGAGWYMPSMLQSQNAAEVIVKDVNGKTMKRIFRNIDSVSKLRENDEIAIFRFVSQGPVLIRSNGFDTTY